VRSSARARAEVLPRATAGDLTSVSWGARWTPDPPAFASAIKYHQKSTSNSTGSSVGSLAPPRATPRLGGVYVSCQYLPFSFVLALRELGLRLRVKAQLSLRASSRGVPPRGWRSGRLAYSVNPQ
jgi:hypothetical protein